MPSFIGTSGADVITPATLSPGVTHDAPFPGAGADTLQGGDGNDTLNGGTGGDSISGGLGADLILYAPTATRDHLAVDGGAGTDVLQVDGGGAGWSFTFGALANGHATLAGARTGQTFDIDNVNVETIQINGGASADHFVVGDHGASRVGQVNLGLGAGDGVADDVTVNTTAGKDSVVGQLLNGDVVLSWTGQKVQIHDLGAGDRISLNAGAGDDSIDLSRTGAAGPAFIVDAGDGNDTLRAANSVMDGAAGDDTFVWIRDGNDTIEGNSGLDTLSVTAGGGADDIRLVDGGLSLAAQVDGANLSVKHVETVNIAPLERADTIFIGDITRAGLLALNIDLAGAIGAPDGAMDTVTFNATPDGETVIGGLASGPGLAVGLRPFPGTDLGATAAEVTGLDAIDRVAFLGTAGADIFTLNLAPTAQAIQIDAGDGDDRIVGPISHSTINGGAGADTIDVERFTAPAGHDQIDGGAGNDTISSGSFNVAHGGDGNDRIASFGSFDQFFGDAGDDELFGGLGGETMSGGGGNDTIVSFGANTKITGDAGDDVMFLQADGVDTILIDAGGSIANGGDGNDTIGTTDLFASDTLQGGAGDDALQYLVTLKGPGQSVFDGGSGLDSLTVNPDAPEFLQDHAEWLDVLSAGGGGVHLTMQHRGVLSPLDATGVETINLTGGNGADQFAIHDLTGAGVGLVSVDLSGSAAPDGVTDLVTLEGTAGADRVVLFDGTNVDLVVSGLPEVVWLNHIDHSGFAPFPSDNTFVSTGAGNDTIDLLGLNRAFGVELFTGAGNDTITGGFGQFTVSFDAGLRGSDQVDGFRSHAVAQDFGDRIDVSELGDLNLAQMKQLHHIFQSGADVVISDGLGSFLTLTNTSLGSLSNADFVF
ncbi:MAG TPA: hypothetical protein VGC92_16825 [Phenylobacterium sp.]